MDRIAVSGMGSPASGRVAVPPQRSKAKLSTLRHKGGSGSGSSSGGTASDCRGIVDGLRQAEGRSPVGVLCQKYSVMCRGSIHAGTVLSRKRPGKSVAEKSLPWHPLVAQV
jgi:hypothetical protein